jgi:hypothetical protein
MAAGGCGWVQNHQLTSGTVPVAVFTGGSNRHIQRVYIVRSGSNRCQRQSPTWSWKAFKRAFGQSPGEYRRDRASSPTGIADVSAAETVDQVVTAAKNGWPRPVLA